MCGSLFSIPEKNFWFDVHGVLCMSSLCRPGWFLTVIMLMCRGNFHHMVQFSCVVGGGPCLAKTSRVVPEPTISQLFLLKNIWVNVLPRTDSSALLLIEHELSFLWQLNEITTFLFLIRDLLIILDWWINYKTKSPPKKTKRKKPQTCPNMVNFVSIKKARVIILKPQKPVGDYIVVMSMSSGVPNP